MAQSLLGQSLLSRKVLEQIVDSLSQAFEIDESLANIRGLKKVTPNLVNVLIKLGNQEYSLAYCDRALKIAPNYPGFVRLRDEIQALISTGIQKIFIKTGVIMFIQCNDKDNLYWGQIKPDDRSPNITFNEKFVGSECISQLVPGAFVEVEVEVKGKYNNLYATQIRITEEEDFW